MQRAPPALTLQWPTLSSSCFVQAAAIPLNHSNLTFCKIIPTRLSCLWTLLIYFPFYGSVDLLGFGSGPLSPPGNSSPINLVSMSCLPVIKNKLFKTSISQKDFSGGSLEAQWIEMSDLFSRFILI